MTITVRAKPFNAMVRSMKKIADPDSPRPMCRRIHLEAFESAPGAWSLRATASDGFRIAEDTMSAMDTDRLDGIRCAEINPPRLAAKLPVKIDMLEDRTVVSFDDVSFTTMRRDDGGQESIGTKDDPVKSFMDAVKTDISAKPGRNSITCSAKYLLESADAMKEAKRVRIDFGAPVDPIVLTGRSENASLVRVVLPMRSSMDDAAYREDLAKTVIPDQKQPGNPIGEEKLEQ